MYMSYEYELEKHKESRRQELIEERIREHHRALEGYVKQIIAELEKVKQEIVDEVKKING